MVVVSGFPLLHDMVEGLVEDYLGSDSTRVRSLEEKGREGGEEGRSIS